MVLARINGESGTSSQKPSGGVKEEVDQLLQVGFIQPCHYADWVSNNVPFHHSCSTYDQLDVGLGYLGSSEHSDSQQQESEDCWGTESLDAAG
jgi:hypothetical protein